MKTIILIFLLSLCSAASATIVSDRIAATNRILPLKKVTVGPDDQYQGSVNPTGQILVYTYKTNLVPHLRVQELKTGEVRDFLPLTADSQEPSFGPGGQIAFTYFKLNARGDICFAEGPNFSQAENNNPKIHCLPRSSDEKSEARSNSFWRTHDEVGYIVENSTTKERKIVTENIRSGAKSILVTGKVFSPAMRPGGRYLSFIRIADEETHMPAKLKRHLVIKDLQNQKLFVANFALPGISGFPAISSDETMLYFSHYPNDSNGDNVLDGSDNAVVFRVPIEKLIAEKDQAKVFPEQLTSLENSCSFPHPLNDLIYVTCAFEGSLDIYQMPATGIVPVKWTKQILDNAVATSRSYQERILLLNTEKYREPSASQITNERLLNNHILADETVAAHGYLDELVQSLSSPKDKEFYALVKIYLEARELKKSQSSQDVSRVFREQIAVYSKRLANIHGEKNFESILQAMLKIFTADYREAAGGLSRIQSTAPMRPLERYLYFELADQSYSHDLPKSESKLLEAYHIMMTAPELNEEAHVYYAFRMLDKIEQQHKDLAQRIKVIDSTKKFLIKPVLTLLDSETCVLRLLLAAENEKPKIYAELDHLMSETSDDYFLRKALYVRSILNFASAAQFTYMELVATSWLKYTVQNDTEFIYARQVVQGSALDQAYANVAIKKDNYASTFFYGSLSLTDDLESHSGFVYAMSRRNLRKNINDIYKNLQQRSFIDDNMKFVEALLILIDQAPKAQADFKFVGHLDQAIEKLNSMSQERDSAVRYLLLGSCYLEKLLRSAQGMDFSNELMQKANRSLMLAYDLGRDNARIQASTLMNLGLLQSRAQNQALAVRFFGLRKVLGFTSAQEKASFAWLYSRALFLSHQVEQAVGEIAEVEASELKSEFLERRAFYLLAFEKYKESVVAYADFFKSKPQLDAINVAKINLSYGYALLKTHHEAEAKNHLILAIQTLDRMSPLSRGEDRSVEFSPIRLKLFAFGFLAQMGEPSERKAALLKRLELLQSDSSLLDDQLSAMIEAKLQIANLPVTELHGRAVHIGDAIRLSLKLGKETGYLAHAVYASGTAALIEGILHPKIFSAADLNEIQLLVQSCMRVYEGQKIPQTFLNFQNLKMKVLNAAFTAKIEHKTVPKTEIKVLMDSNLAMGVKESMPKQWQELSKLSLAVGGL